MKFEFPELPYSFDALEPHIDAQTMELHYTKHHKGYFDKFVAAISGTDLENQSLEEIFSKVSTHSAAVRNNGGGYFNHMLFWENLSPNGGKPSDELMEAITAKYGSFEAFQEKFNNAAATRFGSGWAWLNINTKGGLCINSSANQDNPYMDTMECNCKPILALDVWEHAYYLNYQNRRPEYIAAFWKIINWDVVNKRYSEALSK